MRDYEAMGNTMTTALGFENDKVILYWTALLQTVSHVSSF